MGWKIPSSGTPTQEHECSHLHEHLSLGSVEDHPSMWWGSSHEGARTEFSYVRGVTS